MPQATLDAVISQLDALGLDELQRVEDAVQERLKSASESEKSEYKLAEKSDDEKQADFHQALLVAGLITRIPLPRDPSKAERSRITVLGEPVSETIIRERR